MKILSTIILALMLSGCYHIYVPFQHHHQHWKQGDDIPEGKESHRNQIVIGGQLYVDDIIR